MSLPNRLLSEHVYLRPLTQADATQRYADWLADPQVNRFLESRFQPPTVPQLRDYIAGFTVPGQPGKPKFLWGAFDRKFEGAAHDGAAGGEAGGERHIGNFTVDLNPQHRVAYFGYLIGDKAYWGGPWASECITLVLDFAFEHLGARKLWGGIYKTNLLAVFNIHQFGFTREGVLRGHVLDGDQVTDALYYGILREEWAVKREQSPKIRAIRREFSVV